MLEDGAVEIFTERLQGATETFKAVLDWPECEETDVRGRDKGEAPVDGENTHRQWVWRCNIAGQPGGVLTGKTVAIKDAVTVAGLPMDAGNPGLKVSPEHDSNPRKTNFLVFFSFRATFQKWTRLS